MLGIDLRGKRALVAGVADDGGFGFAIAKSLAEAGASICVGTWPPALNIFETLIRRGKIDESRKLSDGSQRRRRDEEHEGGAAQRAGKSGGKGDPRPLRVEKPGAGVPQR